MITFLPFPDFGDSVRALDDQRLRNQRREAWAVFKMHANHPLARMWSDHQDWLCLYGLEACFETFKRGFVDNMQGKFEARLSSLGIERTPEGLLLPKTPKPSWLGDPRLHCTHKGNLLRKDPVHYAAFSPEVLPMTGYWWPSSEEVQ